MKIKKPRMNYKIVRNGLYILGIILLVYYIYLLYGSCSYVGGLVSVGEIKLSGDFGKVVQYVMTQTFSYLFYSISLLAFGTMISICDKGNQKEEVSHEE